MSENIQHVQELSDTINLNNKESIYVNDLSAGVYEIKFNIKDSNSSYKFVKE